jgi:hypothetical protein
MGHRGSVALAFAFAVAVAVASELRRFITPRK